MATTANSPRAGSTSRIQLSYAQSLTRGFRCPPCDRRFVDNIARWSLTQLIEEMAARTERAVEGQLSGAALKAYRPAGYEDTV